MRSPHEPPSTEICTGVTGFTGRSRRVTRASEMYETVEPGSKRARAGEEASSEQWRTVSRSVGRYVTLSSCWPVIVTWLANVVAASFGLAGAGVSSSDCGELLLLGSDDSRHSHT